MDLKLLIKDKHQQAESTVFMKAVFKRKMPMKVWANWTYNRAFFYATIESKARAEGFMDDLFGLDRAYWLYVDSKAMGFQNQKILSSVIEYHQYILDLESPKVLAHLYTWHMGDLHGGQMIKRVIEAPHRHLDFDDASILIDKIRKKLDNSLVDEVNIAFDWAIKIMNEYDDELSNI